MGLPRALPYQHLVIEVLVLDTVFPPGSCVLVGVPWALHGEVSFSLSEVFSMISESEKEGLTPGVLWGLGTRCCWSLGEDPHLQHGS